MKIIYVGGCEGAQLGHCPDCMGCSCMFCSEMGTEKCETCIKKEDMKIINTTPHPITMQSRDGNVYTVEPCGVLINAKPVEEPARFKPMCGYESKTCPEFHGQCGTCKKAVLLVETRFEATPESEDALTKLERENLEAVIVGSIIAAQAFPGRVFAMVPVKGFERVPPTEKRMRDDKFTVF